MTGIESLALDPTDAGRVYIAAGLYVGSRDPKGAILRSDDQGGHWTRLPLPFKLGGNEDGRNLGERLAVDSAHPATLFYGSRLAGLWRSDDRAATWQRVSSFPVGGPVEGVGVKTGITFVLFAPGTAAANAPIPIYVGVAKPGAGLYRSLHGGVTWQLVMGLPAAAAGSFATRAGVAGQDVYVLFNNMPGPNDVTDGAVVRLGTQGAPEEALEGTHGRRGVHRAGNAVNAGVHAWPGRYGWMSSIEIDPFDAARLRWIRGSLAPLRRDFLPGHLAPSLHVCGVDRIVTVQATETLAETHWLLACAAADATHAGVVGWAPLAHPALPAIGWMGRDRSA